MIDSLFSVIGIFLYRLGRYSLVAASWGSSDIAIDVLDEILENNNVWLGVVWIDCGVHLGATVFERCFLVLVEKFLARSRINKNLYGRRLRNTGVRVCVACLLCLNVA